MGLNRLSVLWDSFVKCYARSVRASIVAMFAVAAPVVIGSAGMALDMSQAYLVKERLGHALDAAALAAAGIAASDEAGADARLNAFMNANYPPEKLGATYNLHMEVDGDTVHVSANADYNTAFLWILGINVITVGAQTAVQREVQGLEVVLVLDNTGSMATNNNIAALKTATRDFINILFANTTNPEAIKVGLVPYSNAVRVGRYGLGKNPDGSTYGDGDVFVTLPADVSYTTNHDARSGWYGCVVEHNPNGYNAAAAYVSGSKGQLWSVGGYPGGHGWNPNRTDNDPYPDDVANDWEGPWDIYQYGKVSKGNCLAYNGGACTQYNYTFSANSTPNNGCPYANVVPLTSDQEFLLGQVSEDSNVMKPHGMTLGNIGMAWGARVLSPEPPFTEAQPWDNKIWRKAIVMMTDGDNTDDGTYSAYWVAGNNQMNVTKYNNRFEEVCNYLKEKDVIVYTITFTSGINDTTRQYYRDCASSESKYFDTPSQEKLISTFNQIANELSNLRITQ